MWQHCGYFVLISLSILFNSMHCSMQVGKEKIDLTKGENKVPKHPKLVEFDKTSHLRPTKCHVCRVLVEELKVELNKTGDLKKSYWLTNRLDGEDKADALKGKKINYKTSEIRIMDILENVCKNVNNYRQVAGPDFPYLKGIKSRFRQNLEEAMGNYGIVLKLDAPEALIEDPTNEIKRMFYECNHMVEKYEDDIMDWYTYKQDNEPLEFLCAERILDPEEQSCLYASTDIPEYAKQPKKYKKGEKHISYDKDYKHEL